MKLILSTRLYVFHKVKNRFLSLYDYRRTYINYVQFIHENILWDHLILEF